MITFRPEITINLADTDAETMDKIATQLSTAGLQAVATAPKPKLSPRAVVANAMRARYGSGYGGDSASRRDFRGRYDRDYNDNIEPFDTYDGELSDALAKKARNAYKKAKEGVAATGRVVSRIPGAWQHLRNGSEKKHEHVNSEMRPLSAPAPWRSDKYMLPPPARPPLATGAGLRSSACLCGATGKRSSSYSTTKTPFKARSLHML